MDLHPLVSPRRGPRPRPAGGRMGILPLLDGGACVWPADTLAFHLLNDFQHDFPLHSRPFDALADRLGCSAAQVLQGYGQLMDAGMVSRIGAVLAPNAFGASTLAALAVPPQQLDAVAALVSQYREVNHNYAREHRYNLWFVLTAPNRARIDQVLAEIGAASGTTPLDLPMAQAYHIDLGFDLRGGAMAHTRPLPVAPVELSDSEQRLLAVLEGGLALVPRPFARLGMRAGMPETEVLRTLARWHDAGALRRFGVVVRHRELGYGANAMCVWAVPAEQVDAHGTLLARQPGVTLCYRRRACGPDWPYNLFCMIHGHERSEVLDMRKQVAQDAGLADLPGAVLFSTRRYKQCGARYSSGDTPTTEGV